jgi:DNA-binding FrmR family transcriptional regulator
MASAIVTAEAETAGADDCPRRVGTTAQEKPMPSIHNLPAEERAEMIGRLKKIEGQAKGIQRMIEEGRECVDVLQQVASVKAAVNGLSAELLEAFALRCLRHPEEFPSPEAAVEQAVRALVRSGR